MKGTRTGVRSKCNYGCWREVVVHLIRADQLGRLHATHERHGNIHLRHVP